jgi:hypothetical protein
VTKEQLEQNVLQTVGPGGLGIWRAGYEAAKAEFTGAIEYVRSWYPLDIFPEDGQSLDCKSARMARITCNNILERLTSQAQAGEGTK